MNVDEAHAVLATVWPNPPVVVKTSGVDADRGVFSTVFRATFAEPFAPPGHPTPLRSVAIKSTRSDANGRSAVQSGAVARETLAYQHLLPRSPQVRHAHWFGERTNADGSVDAVLEDLSAQRWVDQMDGLEPADVLAVTAELAALHDAWRGDALDHPDLAHISLRHHTPRHLPVAGLERGLAAIAELEGLRALQSAPLDALRDLAAARDRLVAAFIAEPGSTLCHGDPRADNLCFEKAPESGVRPRSGQMARAVLFDWQQIAVQFGEADLAWMMATSVVPNRRREIEAAVVAEYGLARGQDAATTWHRYRLGMVLPGLAVLLLAQRQRSNPSVERFVTTSVARIATAVNDLAVSEIVTPR